MQKVKFYGLNAIDDIKLLFAVIVAKYKGKWIFVQHKNRLTWEIPGGHREKDENIDAAASRELIEETGAKKFKITPICIYSVCDSTTESFGQLFFAEIEQLDKMPDFEIGKLKLFDNIPINLTYPSIQPNLFNKVKNLYE